ncbi:MAG: sigma-70 family RNA polymerase sigma factor [Oscillospiraceae bacterium]|nr:sigma-70 family RNA polymerase sigma factor [Oscillospiraceae bacterium]
MNQNEFTFEDTPCFDEPVMSAGEVLEMAAQLDEKGLDQLFIALGKTGMDYDLTGLPRFVPSGYDALRLREEMELVKHEDLCKGLEKNDALRIYLEELAAQPDSGMAPADIAALGEANNNGEDSEHLISRLMIPGMKQVVEYAREYTGYGVLLLDLIQDGNIGLWEALTYYVGGPFETIMEGCVRQHMIKTIIFQAAYSGVGQKLRQAVEDYRMADERLLTDLGRNPTPEEMAEYLHMTVEEVENVRKTLENARMMDKAHTQPEPEEEEEAETQAVEDTAYYQTRERVNDLMSGLTELETEVLNLRYGLAGKPPQSLAETARRLKLTTGQITQIEQTALTKMRAQ